MVKFEFNSELNLICLRSSRSFELGVEFKLNFMWNLVGFEFNIELESDVS